MPYINHPLRKLCRRGGTVLGMLVSVLPKGQFHVSNTKTVLDSIKQWVQMATDRYGSSFRWIKMIGDISAMYDECDPELAIVAAHTAVDSASEWAGKRSVKCCNVSYGGRDGRWGKPNTDRRVVIDFELLLQSRPLCCDLMASDGQILHAARPGRGARESQPVPSRCSGHSILIGFHGDCLGLLHHV